MSINILLSIFIILGIIVLLVVAIFDIKTYKTYKNALDLSYNDKDTFIVISYKNNDIIISLDSIISVETATVETFAEDINRYILYIKLIGHTVEDFYFNNIKERDNLYYYITQKLANHNNIIFDYYDEDINYL